MLRLADGYRPNLGDMIPVLAYPGGLGDFTSLDDLDLGSGLHLVPHFNSSGLTVIATTYADADHVRVPQLPGRDCTR